VFVPKWEGNAQGKKIFSKGGMYLAPEQGPFLHHVFDAFHHVLTIKIPPSNRRYFQNTP
jgi:hypothetical protein